MWAKADFEATLPRASLYIRRRLLMTPMPINPMRFQMARDRNYTGAPINYYQAVCHPHETINSVAPVHRRADKLSRSVARAFSPPAVLAFCQSPPPLHSLFLSLSFSHFLALPIYFLLSISQRYLTAGRLMKIFPAGTKHSSCRQDSDTRSMIYSF